MIPRRRKLSHFDRTRLLLTVLIVLASLALVVTGHGAERSRAAVAR